MRLVSVVLLPIVFAIGITLVYLLGVYPRRALPGQGEPVRYSIPRGATASRVAADLGRLGVIDRPFFFAAYLRLEGASGAFREGRTVLLPFGSTPQQLARRVATGLGAIVARVTIPEGFDERDVALRLEAAQLGTAEDFLRAMHDPVALRALSIHGPSIEGYLFPDTYEFRDDQEPVAILGLMVENHRQKTDDLFDESRDELDALHRDLGFTRRDVVVLASIVEKEAAVADERATIAGVFVNRLRSSTFLPLHRLQSDPTVSYGCRAEPELAPSCAEFDGRITRAMLDDSANRYNTYRHAGLTPGPIANPGLAAIDAVLHYGHHEYLYFVARGGRRHTFSATLEQHNDAVGDSRERGVLP